VVGIRRIERKGRPTRVWSMPRTVLKVDVRGVVTALYALEKYVGGGGQAIALGSCLDTAAGR
jgi:hypothetical protein